MIWFGHAKVCVAKVGKYVENWLFQPPELGYDTTFSGGNPS